MNDRWHVFLACGCNFREHGEHRVDTVYHCPTHGETKVVRANPTI